MLELRGLANIAAAAMLATTGAILVQNWDVPVSAAAAAPAPHVANASADPSRLSLARAPIRWNGSPSPQLHPAQLIHLPGEASAAADMPLMQPRDVAGRMREIVPADLFRYFDLYLYVSKAASGSWAQQMEIFHQNAGGDLVFEESFPVSTGRERMEKYFTSTPAGLFELDPDRFDRVHYSRRWHNAPMPWAMFLNYTIRGHATGVALHSGIGHVADLGHRASGGCVRLPPAKAEELFRRIQASERGLVPEFAMDDTGTTTDKTGRMLRDADGSPVLTDGYRVLLIIEDYPGAPVVVATVS